MTTAKINQELLEALKLAEQWLAGWASAEPQLSIIRTAIANAERAQTQADDLDSRVRAAEGQTI